MMRHNQPVTIDVDCGSVDLLDLNMRHDYMRIWKSFQNEYRTKLEIEVMQARLSGITNMEAVRNEVICKILKHRIVALKALKDLFDKLDLHKYYPEEK